MSSSPGKGQVEKVYVDSFMTEEEEGKGEFDPEEAINSFIIKKDYFVMHREGDIFNDYEVEGKILNTYFSTEVDLGAGVPIAVVTAVAPYDFSQF